MDFYLAQIVLFAGTFAPKGWLPCNGQMLPIAQNMALYSLIGTNFGGDGTTNFALPNLPAPAGTPPGATTPVYLICTEGEYPQRD